MSNHGSGSGTPPQEDWAPTRVLTGTATQLAQDEDGYLDSESADIGRQIAGNDRELFVSCEPALALRQQFEHLSPEYIAVHDIGTHSSRKLLASIAAASGRAVHKLFIRRQGYGTALATLEFVELPTADGHLLRMYTTEVDADTVARQGLARTLLAFSRLAVLMVGDLPTHAVESSFKPLHEEMLAGSWPNRDLLLLPLSAASSLVNLGIELGRGTGVTVRTTPHVMRPADAWSFINGTWGRLRESSPRTAIPAAARSSGASAAHLPRSASAGASSAEGPLAAGFGISSAGSASSARSQAGHSIAPGGRRSDPTSGEEEDTQPLPLSMRPMPEIPTSRSRPAAENLLDRYVHQLSELSGMVSCCIVELTSGRALAHAGASPSAADLASHGAELMASITATCRELGLGHALPDVAITIGGHHVVLRAVPRHPTLALHAVLDKTSANLTLARLQIQRMDTLFDPPA